jgi:hypothetical protein
VAQEDAELLAMQKVVEALGGLEDDERRRVLEWTAKRFGVSVKANGRPATQDHAGDEYGDGGDPEFSDFADLFDAANPMDDNARALVGGYWFQQVQGNATFTGQQVNDSLKDTGNGVGNITNAFSRLQAKTPALVRQVSKSGRAAQARKTYKLTTNGIREVRRLISGVGGAANGADDE